MGSTQSKEEVIIAQAGNSGGITNKTASSPSWTVKEIAEIVVLIMAIIVIFWFCVIRCKAMLRKKIREEISRSREQV